MRLLSAPLLLLAFLLTACGTVSAPPPPVSADAGSFTPVQLNARRLEIIENWQMPIEAPYIGHRQSPYPSNLISQWAAKVLVPAGGSGDLVLDISRAAVTSSKLPRENSLKNALTDEQDSRIRVEFEAFLMWLQPVGNSQARVKLQASHSITVPESSTANDVQRAINNCMLAALEALDAQVRKEIDKIDGIVLP